MVSKYSLHDSETAENMNRPFGSLVLFRETTLAAGSQETLNFDDDMQLLLIPLVGSLRIHTDLCKTRLDVLDALFIMVRKGDTCIISNCCKMEEIHYLLTGFKKMRVTRKVKDFSLMENKLSEIFPIGMESKNLKVSIGKFDARLDSVYKPNLGSKIFVWVIQGVFEVDNCLMERSDGLAIFDIESIEFESLAGNSILLLVEF